MESTFFYLESIKWENRGKYLNLTGFSFFLSEHFLTDFITWHKCQHCAHSTCCYLAHVV